MYTVHCTLVQVLCVFICITPDSVMVFRPLNVQFLLRLPICILGFNPQAPILCFSCFDAWSIILYSSISYWSPCLNPAITLKSAGLQEITVSLSGSHSLKTGTVHATNRGNIDLVCFFFLVLNVEKLATNFLCWVPSIPPCLISITRTNVFVSNALSYQLKKVFVELVSGY